MEVISRMVTIKDAVSDQLDVMMRELFKHRKMWLQEAGISKQRRNYLKGREQANKKRKTLPPTDAVFAALIVLGGEIVVNGVSRPNDGQQSTFAIVAVERRGDSRQVVPQK